MGTHPGQGWWLSIRVLWLMIAGWSPGPLVSRQHPMWAESWMYNARHRRRRSLKQWQWPALTASESCDMWCLSWLSQWLTPCSWWCCSASSWPTPGRGSPGQGWWWSGRRRGTSGSGGRWARWWGLTWRMTSGVSSSGNTGDWSTPSWCRQTSGAGQSLHYLEEGKKIDRGFGV